MELQAIHDAVRDVTSKLSTIQQLDVFTDSLAAIQELKKVHKVMEICEAIHKMNRNTATCIRVHWIQGHAANPHNIAADQQAHCPPNTDLPSIPLPPQPLNTLRARKNVLRQDTRALIPPCVCSLPLHLTRAEEVVLRRLRAGVALTPAVISTWNWSHLPVGSTCPYCSVPVMQADAYHLIWTCQGLQSERSRHLLQAGLRYSDTNSYDRWIHDNTFHKTLLHFIHNTGLTAHI